MQPEIVGELNLQRFYSTYAKLLGERYRVEMTVKVTPSDTHSVTVKTDYGKYNPASVGSGVGK